MLNTIGKKGNLILSLTFAGLISGCLDNGNSNKGKDNTSNIPQNTPAVKINDTLVGKVSLSTVQNALVEITHNDNILYSTFTDDNGQYTIDVSRLKTTLSNYNIPEDSYLDFITHGGNTSNGEFVNGNLHSIKPLSKIDNSVISHISTLVYKILSGENDTKLQEFKNSNGTFKIKETKQAIIDILKQLDIPDINGDGKIDLNDMVGYDLEKYNSQIENKIISQGFRQSLIDGNINSSNDFVNNILTEISLVKYTFNGNYVELKPYDNFSTLYYSFDGINWQFYNSKIDFSYNNLDKLYFKERYPNNQESIIKSIDLSSKGAISDGGGKTTPDQIVLDIIPDSGNPIEEDISIGIDRPIPNPEYDNYDTIIKENPNSLIQNISYHENELNELLFQKIEIEDILNEISNQIKELETNNTGNTNNEYINKLNNLEKRILNINWNQTNSLINSELNSIHNELNNLKNTNYGSNTTRSRYTTRKFNAKNGTNTQVLTYLNNNIKRLENNISNIQANIGNKEKDINIKKRDVENWYSQMESTIINLNGLKRDISLNKRDIEIVRNFINFFDKEISNSKNIINEIEYLNNEYNSIIEKFLGINRDWEKTFKNFQLWDIRDELINKIYNINYPGSNNYALDRTSNTKNHNIIYSTQEISYMGNIFRIKVKFGREISGKDYPAYIYLEQSTKNYGSSIIKTEIQVRNEKHLLDFGNILSKSAKLNEEIYHLDELINIEGRLLSLNSQIENIKIKIYNELDKLRNYLGEELYNELRNDPNSTLRKIETGTQNKINEMEIELSKEEQNIKNLENNIKSIETTIYSVEDEIEKLNNEIKALKKEIEENRNVIRSIEDVSNDYELVLNNVPDTNGNNSNNDDRIRELVLIEVETKNELLALSGREQQTTNNIEYYNNLLERLNNEGALFKLSETSTQPESNRCASDRRYKCRFSPEEIARGTRTMHINGGSYNSAEHQKYPYVIHMDYMKNNQTNYPADLWIEYKVGNDMISTSKIRVNGFKEKDKAVKETRQEIIQRIDLLKKMSNLSKLESEKVLDKLYSDLQIALDGGFFGDGHVEELKNLSKNKKELMAETFSAYMFEHNLKFDNEFKRGFEEELERQTKQAENNIDVDGNGLTQAERQQIRKDIARGIKEGGIKATRDYLMQYADLVQALSNVTLDDVSNGLKRIWGVVSDPVGSVKKVGSELIEFKNHMNAAYDIIRGLGVYEKSFGGTYISATVGFIGLDPAKKAEALLGKTRISENAKKIFEEIKTLQREYRIRILKSFKDLTSTQRIRFYDLMVQHEIKNPLTFIHVQHGEWRLINGEKRLNGGLHSMREVESLLKKRDIQIRAKVGPNGNWQEIDYNTYRNITDENIKSNIQVKSSQDSRSWNELSKDSRYGLKKSLFPNNWTDADIAILISRAENDIQKILRNKGLPEKGTPNTQWRYSLLDQNGNPIDITETFTINGKPITVRLGGKYDSNGNLDFNIETLYP